MSARPAHLIGGLVLGLVLGLALGLVAPGAALGQDAPSFETLKTASATELTRVWIDQLFGSGLLSGGPPSLIGSAMGYFNSIGLAVVSVFLLIRVFQDILHAGKEGEARGAATHPLRFVAAFIALVPVGNGGLGVLSMFSIWIAGLGGAMASHVWQMMVVAITSTGAVIVSAPPPAQDWPMIDQLVRSAACAEIYNSKAKDQGLQAKALTFYSNPSVIDSRPPVVLASGSGDIMGNYTGSAQPLATDNIVIGYRVGVAGIPVGVCGGLRYTTVRATDGAETIISALASRPDNPYLGALQAKANAMATVAPDAQALGAAMAKALSGEAAVPPDGWAGEMDAIYRKYADAVRAPLAAALTKISLTAEAQRVATAAKGSSWAVAAAWYIDLSWVSGQTAKAASAQLEIDPITYDAWGLSSPQAAKDGADKLKAVNLTISNLSRSAAGSIGPAESYSTNGLTRLLMPTVNVTDGTSLGKGFGAINPAPLTAINRYGWTLAEIGGSVLFAKGVAAALPGALAKKISDILSAGTFVAGLMMIAGLFMCFALPLWAFIEFFLATVGWLIEVAILVIGSFAFAVRWALDDSPELLGRDIDAFRSAALSVFFRPTLMVFCLFLSMGIFTITVGLLTVLIVPQIASLSEGSGIIAGLVNTIAAPIGFALILGMLGHKCFSMIHSGPDRILAVFGVGSSSASSIDAVGARFNTLVNSFRSGGRMSGGGNGGSKTAGSSAGNGGTGASIAAVPVAPLSGGSAVVGVATGGSGGAAATKSSASMGASAGTAGAKAPASDAEAAPDYSGGLKRGPLIPREPTDGKDA